MNKDYALENLASIADETLAGLHADNDLKRRIMEKAVKEKAPVHRARRTFVPALCAVTAAAVVCIVGVRMQASRLTDGTVNIETIAAGGAAQDRLRMVAGLGDGASVNAGVPAYESLYAAGEGDMPLVSVNGAVYRMLETPQNMGASLLGAEVGTVKQYTDEPSLASEDALRMGVSNVAAQDTAIYTVGNLPASTAVAAEVDGCMRLFQRVSYAGKGPGTQTLEETFSVRGQVKTLELSGVGTLTGEQANAAIALLLDHATLRSVDATARRQSLTVTLENGLKLQLGVSGDTLCGCGGWSCPEFFDAFSTYQ